MNKKLQALTPKIGEYWYVRINGGGITSRLISDITPLTIELSDPEAFTRHSNRRYEHSEIAFIEKAKA